MAGIFTLGGASRPDPAPLLRLPRGERAATPATHRSRDQLAAALACVPWAKGALGTTAHCGCANAFIELPPVPLPNS